MCCQTLSRFQRNFPTSRSTSSSGDCQERERSRTSQCIQKGNTRDCARERYSAKERAKRQKRTSGSDAHPDLFSCPTAHPPAQGSSLLDVPFRNGGLLLLLRVEQVWAAHFRRSPGCWPCRRTRWPGRTRSCSRSPQGCRASSERTGHTAQQVPEEVPERVDRPTDRHDATHGAERGLHVLVHGTALSVHLASLT